MMAPFLLQAGESGRSGRTVYVGRATVPCETRSVYSISDPEQRAGLLVGAAGAASQWACIRVSLASQPRGLVMHRKGDFSLPDHTEAEIAAAVEACAEEPVHIPGAIQSFGCMLVCDGALSKFQHASANVEAFLGLGLQQALAMAPEEVLGVGPVSQLRAGLASRDRLSSALTVTCQPGDEAYRFFLMAYRVDDRIVVELEPLVRQSGRRLLSVVNTWLRELAEAHQVNRLLNVLVEGVRHLTGHERVLVYEFDSEWNGAVVAESLAEGVNGFLGHHFPASDIPPQVRRLYDLNPVRTIPDARAAAVPLVPRVEPPLDLSAGVLRAASPVHCVYMQNMGVGASLSVAIHGDTSLWGLLTCHGLRPHAVSPVVRDAVHTLVQMAAQRMFLLHARGEARYLQEVLDSRELVSEERGELRSPSQLLQHFGSDWLKLFRASGIALSYRTSPTVATLGELPPPEVLQRLWAWLDDRDSTAPTWTTSELQRSEVAHLGVPETFAGMLAVQLRIERSVSGWLLLFRKEVVHQRRWGGNPGKLPIAAEDGRLRLSPRESFDSWLEEVRGQSEHWRDIECRAALDLGKDLAVAISAHEIGALNAQLIDANQRLEQLAHTDPLTQVWNRYRIELAIDSAFSAAERYGEPCSLLLFDIDEFKAVNDTYGHDVGDQVLRTLAREVSGALRESDQLGRWGGEEFLVLATHTGLEQARLLAERLRAHVAGVNFPVVKRLTVSIGVADWRRGEPRRVVIERADRAMYSAKQAGRNQVAVAGS